MLELPFTSDLKIYRVSTLLGDAPITFDVRWNARDEAWYVDAYNELGELLAAGTKLVLGTVLFRNVTNPDLPLGGFVVFDRAQSGKEATVDDLGTRVIVGWIPPEELNITL